VRKRRPSGRCPPITPRPPRWLQVAIGIGPDREGFAGRRYLGHDRSKATDIGIAGSAHGFRYGVVLDSDSSMGRNSVRSITSMTNPLRNVILSSLFIVACLATRDAYAESWEKVHDGQVTQSEGSEVLGTNQVFIDTDSIVREGAHTRYRIRIVSTILGSKQDTVIQRVSNCEDNRFHRIEITDRNTGQTAAPQAQQWRDVTPPFNDKIQTRVCN